MTHVPAAGAASPTIATDPLLRRAFVGKPESGALSIFNLDRLSLVAVAPLGGDARAVVSDTASSRVFVLNGGSPGSVAVLDAGGEMLARIPVGDDPQSMAPDFLRGELFVGNAASGTMSVIDVTTSTVVATVAVGTSPTGLAVDRARGRIYVADGETGSVAVVDEETRAVLGTVDVGGKPTVPIVDEHAGRAFVISAVERTVSVVDGDTRTVVATLRAGEGPVSGTFAPVYRKYYVTNATDGTLTVVDADALRVLSTVPVGASPRATTVDPDDGAVYVAAEKSDAVTVLGAGDGRTVRTIGTTVSPNRIALDGDDRLLVVDDATGTPSLVSRSSQAPETAIAAEYYHAGFDHYFHASAATEKRLLDDGLYGDAWMPTHEYFRVWTMPGEGRVPVCRLYTAALTPRSSHVYTPYAAECDALKAAGTWQFESIAYFVALPNAKGYCADGTEPLYRLYNDGQGGAPNHRFTRERGIRDAMEARGWVVEGSGVDHVFACTPALRVDGVASSAVPSGPPLRIAPPVRTFPK